MYTGQATRIFTRSVATPAAGAEFALAPTGQGPILVLSLTARFTASAAVANRIPTLAMSDGNAILWRSQAPAAVAALGAVTYQMYEGAFPSVGGGGLVTLGWPVGGLWLPQGSSIASLTTLIDAADQWDQINALVQEFPSGPDFQSFPTAIVYAEPLDG